MMVQNLFQRSDVINLVMNYSLNNNVFDPKDYKSHTKQSDEILEIINKKYTNIKLDPDQEKRIISTICPVTNKEIVVPSRGIFCKHLDCINYSEMLNYVTLVKLIFFLLLENVLCVKYTAN